MKYDEIRHAWNTQTDDWSGWYYGLSEYEKVEWAARFGAATERATRQKAQEEVVFLKNASPALAWSIAGLYTKRCSKSARRVRRCAMSLETKWAAVLVHTTAPPPSAPETPNRPPTPPPPSPAPSGLFYFRTTSTNTRKKHDRNRNTTNNEPQRGSGNTQNPSALNGKNHPGWPHPSRPRGPRLCPDDARCSRLCRAHHHRPNSRAHQRIHYQSCSERSLPRRFA